MKTTCQNVQLFVVCECEDFFDIFMDHLNSKMDTINDNKLLDDDVGIGFDHGKTSLTHSKCHQDPQECRSLDLTYSRSPPAANCDDKAEELKKCPFDILPYELIQNIFSYLSVSDLCCSASLVCKQWYQISYDPIFWQTFVMKYTPDMDLTLQMLMQRMPLLKRLFLSGSEGLELEQMSDLLNGCPALHELGLGFCDSVDYDFVKCISENCINIRTLNVEGCRQIDAKCVDEICKMQHLRNLNLSHCNFLEDDSISQLARSLTYIEKLNIDGISWITDSAVNELARYQADHLIELDLDGAELTDVAFRHLTACSKLQHLSLSFAELLTDASLIHLKKMTTLCSLKIRKGNGLTNSGICELFNSHHFTDLRILDLSECADIRDSGVLSIVKSVGAKMECLALEWCWEITDIGLISIIDHCSSLKVLDLLGLELLLGHSFERIPEDLPNLELLNLQQCNRIEDDVIFDVIKRKKDLVAIHYYGEKFIAEDSGF